MGKKTKGRRGGSLALVGTKLIESLVPLGIFLGLKKIQRGRRTRKIMKYI